MCNRGWACAALQLHKKGRGKFHHYKTQLWFLDSDGKKINVQDLRLFEEKVNANIHYIRMLRETSRSFFGFLTFQYSHVFSSVFSLFVFFFFPVLQSV